MQVTCPDLRLKTARPVARVLTPRVGAARASKYTSRIGPSLIVSRGLRLSGAVGDGEDDSGAHADRAPLTPRRATSGAKLGFRRRGLAESWSITPAIPRVPMAQMKPGSRASVVGRVAGLAAIASLQTYWFLQPTPLAFKGLAALLVVVSITTPASGLLIFAGLSPLSTVLARLCGSELGAQLLEQMALAVGAGALMRSGPPDGRTRIGAPAMLVAVVALASGAAMAPAEVAPFAHGFGTAGLLLQQFVDPQAPLFAAVTIAECGLLGWAVERTVRRSPDLATRFVAIALIGQAAMAILNLQRVFDAALRTGNGLHALPQLLMSARVSMQMDWNAGASTLLLAGVAGLGLLCRPFGRRAGIALLLVLVGMGVWITGSRIAISMGVGALVVAIGWSTARAGRQGRFIVAGVALSVLAMGAWLVTSDPGGRNDPISRSITVRLVMFQAGVHLFEQAPVFGIGITKFYDASAAVVGPILTSMGGGPRENAHNNFIQVLAEEGLVGLGAMLWWLAVILVAGARAQLSKPDPVRGGLLLAIVACIGTWLTGHPLLVPEFALVFWFYCGILTATTSAPPPTRAHRVQWVLAATVLVSVPLRANALMDVADLDHIGFGLSLWQHDDAQRYQEAGESFALYLPASGRPVEVPVRRAPGAPNPLVIDIRVRGRLTNSVTIAADAWQTLLVVVPPRSRRFELVDFVVHPPTSGADTQRVMLRIGRSVAR
jgi:hypothetical protein